MESTINTVQSLLWLLSKGVFWKSPTCFHTLLSSSVYKSNDLVPLRHNRVPLKLSGSIFTCFYPLKHLWLDRKEVRSMDLFFFLTLELHEDDIQFHMWKTGQPVLVRLSRTSPAPVWLLHTEMCSHNIATNNCDFSRNPGELICSQRVYQNIMIMIALL